MLKQTVELQSFADISEFIEGFNIVSTKFGADGRVYVLLINEIPEREKGMFVPATLKQVYTYKVLIVTDKYIDEVVIGNQKYNYHYVQPLQNHLLLVGARCSYYAFGKHDLNAKVCDYDGRTVREFLLGDGIQSVQVTEKGTIWTSYFDEGIFGNYGWDDPVGANGLLAWDEFGNKLYENQVAEICDCYALNVVDEKEIWFYYYTDFSLGCISGGLDQSKITFMNPEISGSSGFCTDGYHFLFDGGYGKHGTFILKKNVKPGSLSNGHKINFLNEQGKPLIADKRDFRKNRVLFSEGSLLYQVAVEQL
ncbi:hypothetical protein I6N90_13035 [Paenibacillus sp. GSMTC-2017]|uniref:hypothetical protein n=1 Tax=Paenibacillus sp. GSMTC-2017 TaxID=2794350 RepID=UPI0018D67C18|nr:hypothetical protein [Paenibacillus sp. GSMTC-2017]MBH5318724.1 hypothetical protein [Paenibacillus sp. GSMTC-2017]